MLLRGGDQQPQHQRRKGHQQRDDHADRVDRIPAAMMIAQKALNPQASPE
jgi:hypothetical protein